MNKILKQLKLDLQLQDLSSQEEQSKHEHILSTFEHIATNNTNKPMRYVLGITAEELDMTPEDLISILDKYYQYEEEDDE